MRTEELMKNIEAFEPSWRSEWQPNPKMLDFEEKWQAFHTPDGRLMTCAHRGDRNEIYPENSCEGFLSVILAGADIIEVDVHTTKDGLLVVMHDDTVTRTTNVSSLRASGEQWLPDTDEIHGWTLEEIRRLRLRGKDGEVTEYAVPMLDEVIAIAKDRAFVTLDKAYDFSWENGVMPLIEKHEAYRTVLIPYNYKHERAFEIQKSMKEKYGESAAYFAEALLPGGVMDEGRMRGAASFLKEHGMTRALRCGEYFPEQREKLCEVMSELKGNFRVYAETLRDVHDNHEHWEQMLDIGYNIIMGNRIYDVLKMTKERFFD